MLWRRGTLGAAVAACLALLLAACSFDGMLSPDGTTDVDSDGTDVPDDAELAIDRTSLDFGPVNLGTSRAETFTVTNTGATDTGVIAATIADATNVFARTTNCSTLAPGATCTVTVAFEPTAVGPRTATLTVAGSPGGSVEAVLIGSGSTITRLTVAPSTFSFGNVVVDQDSPSQQFVVTNNRDDAIGPLAVTISNSEFHTTADTCDGATLAAGATCAIDVAVTPTSAGSRGTLLTIQGGETTSATLAANGVISSDAALVATPSTGNFPDTVILTTSSSQTFTIQNVGILPTGALSVDLTGVDFDLLSDTCEGVTLAPDATCSVVVAFNPVTAGMKTGSITVEGPPGTVTVALAGTGQAGGSISVSPDVRDFGSTVVGTQSAPTTFTVSNPGSMPTGPLAVMLSGANANQFLIQTNNCMGMTLPMNGSCTVIVRYQPTTSVEHVASLVAQGTPGGTDVVPLSGNGVDLADIVANPTILPFGSVPVGTSSAPQTVTVSYAGTTPTGPLSVTSSSARFVVSANTCTGTTLNSSSCTFAVSFAPNAAQSVSGTITVTATPGGIASIAATGTGTAMAALTIAPPSHEYGMVPVGTTSLQRRFVVTNIGTAVTGTLTASLLGASPGAFDIVGTTCSMATLAAGASCNVDVVFEPTSTAVSTATLSVTGSPGGTVSATLRGTGTVAAVLDSSPDSLAFGTVVLGQTSTQSVTITNTGNAPSGTVSVAITGADASRFTVASDDCSGQPLLATESCDLTINFVPLFVGPRTASLVINATAGGPLSIPMSGSGLEGARLVPNPTTVAFGSVSIGSPSSIQTITVSNVGGATSMAVSVTLGGPDPTQFDLSADTCTGTMLDPGQSCTFAVRFDPTSTGLKLAAATISASGAAGASVGLLGTGVAPAELTITPARYDFGAIAVGSASGTHDFIVSNVGGTASGPISVALTGTAAAEYDIPADGCNGMSLPPNASCTVKVQFAPSSVGLKSASLGVAATPGNTVTATLAGTGFDPLALTITPTTRNFGNVSVGSDSTGQDFLITNTGALTLNISSVTIGGANPGEFEITNDGCTGATLILLVAPTCAISGRFTPGSTGNKNATFVVSSAQGPMATATVSGRGN